MDSPDGAEAVVTAPRDCRPDLVVVARAPDARHADRLYALGVTDAVPETIEASLQLSESLLVDLGVPIGLVIASIHEKRDEYRKLLNQPQALGARGRRARDAIKSSPNPAKSEKTYAGPPEGRRSKVNVTLVGIRPCLIPTLARPGRAASQGG